MPDRVIKFRWDNIIYIVDKPEFPILLPTGEVLSGDSWIKEKSPPSPENLKLFFIIYNIENQKVLENTISLFKLNVATAVSITEIVTCPSGCLGALSVPYCSQCGSKVKVTEVIKPLSFRPMCAVNPREKVGKDGRCPNCHTFLGINKNEICCPVCNLRLDWNY